MPLLAYSLHFSAHREEGMRTRKQEKGRQKNERKPIRRLWEGMRSDDEEEETKGDIRLGLELGPDMNHFLSLRTAASAMPFSRG